MVNPDHTKGGIVGAAIVLFVVAASNLGLGLFAGPELSKLATGTGDYAEYAARLSFAQASVLALCGLALLFIGTQPKTRMLIVAVIGFAIMAACMVIITIFADSRFVHAYGWHLLAGMLGGAATIVVAVRRYAKLTEPMFADPSNDWQH